MGIVPKRSRQRFASRSGLGILSSLGLGELAASSPQDYVGIPLALARDLPRLERLRSSLRSRFDHSPLRDEKRFAAYFERGASYGVAGSRDLT